MSLADKKQTNQRFQIFFKKRTKKLNYHANPKYLANTKRRRVATSDSLDVTAKSALHHHNEGISIS